ncbi:hypothetical protein [Bacteroides sp. 519]|uniref:hypothetical protein n=1 Tax=Bacteroides sp. 519 TaxID=2302937 RepID=UPI0013D43813|nr:hypothetical protein [Bacteroides sp. 519]
MIDKEDGKLIPLSINVSDRISKTVSRVRTSLGSGVTFNMFQLFTAGAENAIISDISLDTIYSFKNMTLSPIAYRIPPVQVKKKYPKVVIAEFDTDYFTVFRIVDMIFDPVKRHQIHAHALRIIWDKRTKRFEEWKVYDYNYGKDRTRFPDNCFYSNLPRNHGEDRYKASDLVERYQKGELKGELKEIASRLKEDDNLVLVIAHYK